MGKLTGGNVGSTKRRTIIAGSRAATHKDVCKALELCPWASEIGTVISGTAQGADRGGELWAKINRIPLIQFPANWSQEGKGAGLIRNRKMAQAADSLIAIWDGVSRGTKHMIMVAEFRKLQVFVHRILRKT